MFLKPKTILLQKSGFPLAYYGQLVEGKLPLLFLHRTSGCGLLWKEQLVGLSMDFCPLALDLPGHGCSGGDPSAKISIYRDHVKDFIESLGLPPFVLGGHSMGGAITLSYALEYPQDLKALLLVATGARLRVLPQILKTYEQGQHDIEQMMSYSYGPEADAGLKEEGKKLFLSVEPGVSFADFLACDRFDVMEHLHLINLPSLILCGEQDLLTPPKYSRFLAQKIAKSKLRIFPGSGHMVLQEKSEEVNKAIAEFVAML